MREKKKWRFCGSNFKYHKIHKIKTKIKIITKKEQIQDIQSTKQCFSKKIKLYKINKK